MNTSRLDFSGVAIVDNHAHPLVRRQPDTAASFRENFTEAHSPLLASDHVASAVHYRWALRQLGAVLGVAPTEEAILRHRSDMGLTEYARLLLRHAHIAYLLLDEGYPPPDLAVPSAEMEEMVGVRALRILRLETLLQTLLARHGTMADVIDAFDGALETAVQEGCVALKSIAAYRSGLQIQPVSDDEVQRAWSLVSREIKGRDFRLTSKPLIDFFVLRAVRFAARTSLPVQFHTGYGDPDLDLRLANPLHLRELFEDSSLAAAPIVLLHGSYPFTAEAAYLAASYPNAFLDLAFSLPPLDRPELERMAHVAFGVAPASKLMCSSDGTRIPEHYWLGAVRARECISRVLGRMVGNGDVSEDDAMELGTLVLRDNAIRTYGLKD